MSTPFILSPSLLSADFGRLDEELAAIEAAKIPWIHLDVMDGTFVPNITIGPVVIESLRKKSGLFFDTHLMVQNPERYIPDFARAGADLICVHAEATAHLERAVSLIRSHGKKAAVALNPATPLSAVEWLLPDLDMVLVMSVNPGFGGQGFLPFCLDKISRLKRMRQGCGSKALIQVDGGITLDNAMSVLEAGADVLVSGSAFFKYPPYDERLNAFHEAVS